MPNEFQYIATLQMDQMIRSLHSIDKQMEEVGKTGQSAFGGTTASAQKTGQQIGITSGLTASLTFELLQMGKAGVQAFADILVESVKVAGQAQVTQNAISGIFAGQANQGDLAIQTFQLLREQNRELGVDLSRLAPNFLPFVEKWEDFVKLGKQASALAALDPQAGIEGATRALRDAVSGEFRALRQIFEINTDPIIEAVKQFGEVEGVIIGLEQVLEERGQDFESLEGTVILATNRIKAQWTDALQVLGMPIAETLAEDFGEFFDTIEDGKIEIDVLLDTFGVLIAMIADLFLESAKGTLLGVDLEKLTAIILEVQNFIIILQEAQNILTGGEDSAVSQFIDRIWDLEVAFTAANQAFQLFMGAVATNLHVWRGMAEMVKESTLGRADGGESLSFGNIKDLIIEGDQVFFDTVKRTNDLVQENIANFENRAAVIEKNSVVDTEFVNSGLELNKLLKDQQTALADADKIREEMGEAREDLREEDVKGEMKRAELLLKQERARSDLEMKMAEARAKAQRKFYDDLEKIQRKHLDRLADVRLDLTRDREDALLDAQTDRIDLEREEAKELEEIEKDHFRELIRIRERFEWEIADAIRKQDAIAFVDAVRRAERAREEARRDRDEETEDAMKDFEDRRNDIEENLQAELEAINKANRRALEDLNNRLMIEMRERRIARDIELRELALAEERKRKEQDIAFQRQNEDMERKLRERRQKFVDGLLKIEADFKAHLARMQEIDRKIGSLSGGRRSRSPIGEANDSQAGGSRTTTPGGDKDKGGGSADTSAGDPLLVDLTGDTGRLPSLGPSQRRQAGGPVRFGQSYLVGEDGPEVLKMFGNGTVFPNQHAFTPGGTGNSVSSTVNNQMAMNLGMLSPDSLSAQQIQIINNMIGQAMIELLGAGAPV